MIRAVYQFWRDPLWWCACVAYATNRLLLAPLFGGQFLHGQFNDLWLIPAALPPVLWLQSILRLRSSDAPPSPGEVTLHWMIWSVVAECVAPLILPHCVGDWHDVVAYGVGAVVATAWWRRPIANA